MKTLGQSTLLCVVVMLLPLAVAPPTPKPRAIEVQIRGTFVDAAGGRGVLSGDIELQRFEVQQGAVVLVGQIEGSLADSAGTPLGRVDQQGVLPTLVVRSTCDLLHLELGPTDADVLGQHVQLRTITLGLDRRFGPQPQFRALLCAAAEAIDAHAGVGPVAVALNNVLRVMELPK